MECERLQRLVKSWYTQVQAETMAPARMVLFMENHLAECHTCLADPVVRQEMDKIVAIILPPSKVRKPSATLDEEEEDLSPVPEEETEEGEENEETGDNEEESGDTDEEVGEEDEFDEDDDI